ncbi:hypothetical protein RN001_009631 [Aquatica leii]|uniref:FAM69 N-terminal domain-containing protein n=1 Tax=Aquatica leii TaxID=1421715 RepID=A0AAN7SQ07_9COLE|nr:hypothetical protein RN001_009631 [Aquatica leii]
MYKRNWFCTNFDAQRHINKMCDLFKKGRAEGNLCVPLCDSQEQFSFSCQAYHSTKEAVFRVAWGDIRFVLKSAISNIPALHWYDNGALKYPSEKEFLSTVRAVTKNMLNYTLPNTTLYKLAFLKPKSREMDIKIRRIEMDNIWILIQDNEYLMSKAYSDRDIFPQVMGTCGPYFGLEYVQPLSEPYSILYDDDTKDNWKKNVKLSMMIMEIIEELDNNFVQPLHLCDAKLRDFGVTDIENGKAKILDLDTVYPKSIVSRFIKDIDKCNDDTDCKYYDCRGRCNKDTQKCSKSLTNNNLQLVCEKVFLGWKMSNRILIPGLLLSKYAPDELMVALRQCANPEGEDGIPRGAASEDIRKQIYNILVEIDQYVETETFK